MQPLKQLEFCIKMPKKNEQIVVIQFVQLCTDIIPNVSKRILQVYSKVTVQSSVLIYEHLCWSNIRQLGHLYLFVLLSQNSSIILLVVLASDCMQRGCVLPQRLNSGQLSLTAALTRYSVLFSLSPLCGVVGVVKLHFALQLRSTVSCKNSKLWRSPQFCCSRVDKQE